jgi:hypothetical protein
LKADLDGQEDPMRTLLITVGIAFAAYGQTGFGSLSGSVSNQAQAPAAGLKVEAKNVATGIYYKAISSAKGEYTFAQLPAGTYEVSVLQLLFHPFVRTDVAVPSGQTKRLDIQLSADASVSGIGEFPQFLEMAFKRPPPPQGPTPKMPDGKPDFSGVWMLRPADVVSLLLSPPVDLLPWAEALVRERFMNQERDTPALRCLPTSEVLIDGLPFRYVQTPAILIKLVQDNPAAHQILLDGRPLPKDLDPSWRGYSTGRWDGDTLVIDTVGYNDKSWLFFLVPHTTMLHVTQRLRRPDLGHLEIETTYDDPGAFRTPAKFKVVNLLAPDETVDEVVCENNQDPEHISAH